MPIWDEEWTWFTPLPKGIKPNNRMRGHSGSVCFPEGGHMLVRYDPGNYGYVLGAQRGQLAAAAPAMARLLLSLEWAGDRGIDLCPACGNGKSWLAFDDQDGEPKGGHAPDCRWLAVMRAAGVRE